MDRSGKADYLGAKWHGPLRGA